MLSTIFTLDYEIHGNGEGCPYALMVAPTRRLLDLFDEFGAKLTVMADVAEILKFKEYFVETGRDKFYSRDIELQLQDVIRRGHDVQLHIHSSYFRAHFNNRQWVQDWSEYDFAKLPLDRMDWMIRTGKIYLESLLKPLDPEYRCVAFRAANWSVSPSRNVVTSLEKNGIRIDTSIFKYGRRSGRVNFDYSAAVSELCPWPVSADDMCRRDEEGSIWEYPIYAENRNVVVFLTVNRILRVLQGRAHRLNTGGKASVVDRSLERDNPLRRICKAFEISAWKADFNQCTGGQLIRALNRAEKKIGREAAVTPFVLIGHSKLFNRYNSASLRPLLSYVERTPLRFQFGILSDMPQVNPLLRMSGENSRSCAVV